MTCRDVEDALANPSLEKTNQRKQPVQEHIDNCEQCQDLVRVLELPVREAHMGAEQLERLQKIIVNDLRPVRPLPPSWVFFVAFALIFVGFCYLGVSSLRPTGWFVLMPGQKIAVFASLAASAALLAFSLVGQMVPGQKSLLRPGLLPVSLFVWLCLVAAGVFQMRADPHFLRSGEACLKAGVPYAIPAAFIFWLILRHGAILSSRIVGALTGMLAGLVSTTVLEVHCPNMNMWHILVWHFGIALLGMIAGLLVATAGQAIHDRVA